MLQTPNFPARFWPPGRSNLYLPSEVFSLRLKCNRILGACIDTLERHQTGGTAPHLLEIFSSSFICIFSRMKNDCIYGNSFLGGKYKNSSSAMKAVVILGNYKDSKDSVNDKNHNYIH